MVCDAIKISAGRDFGVMFEGRSSRRTDLMEDGAIRQQIDRVRDREEQEERITGTEVQQVDLLQTLIQTVFR